MDTCSIYTHYYYIIQYIIYICTHMDTGKVDLVRYRVYALCTLTSEISCIVHVFSAQIATGLFVL